MKNIKSVESKTNNSVFDLSECCSESQASLVQKTGGINSSMKCFQSLIASGLLSSMVFTGLALSDARLVSTPLEGKPAVAGWSDLLPIPSGMYFELNGKKFYFGEYSDRGDDAIVYKGSKWEVKTGGRVSAHGYGQTPSWLVDLAKRVFRFR